MISFWRCESGSARCRPRHRRLRRPAAIVNSAFEGLGLNEMMSVRVVVRASLAVA